MTESNEHPDLNDDPAMGAVRKALDEAADEGQVVLGGPVTVQLILKVQDALTPEEAVDLVITRIAHLGLDRFTFAVTDPQTGDNYYVQAGRLLDFEEVEAQVEEARAGS